MAFLDYLVVIAVVVIGWSQYRCYLLQEKLSLCSESTSTHTGQETESAAQESPPLGESLGGAKELGADREILRAGSSVWCSGSSSADRMCRFHNLCFSQKHEEFVFLTGPQSVSSGLPQNPFNPALVDLSSVPNHNTQFFQYCHLHVEALEEIQSVTVYPGKHLLLNRFNPGNIMHVFHDDLLPLFYTMLENGLMIKQDFQTDARLVFMDGHPGGDFLDLYIALFSRQPVLRDELLRKVADSEQDSMICFEEAHVGLSNTTTWYQYGFDIPQGPVPNTLLTSSKVKLFTSFVYSKLHIKRCLEPAHVVLISRKSTRLILNEMELVLQVAQTTGLRVITAGLEDSTTEELIELVSCAKVLIGMHGSLLILSMFLPRGSVLLEMFPYAINPDHYTPYKTLVQLPGTGIIYSPWSNVNPDNSVAHPDALPSEGGISHLSPEDQRQILTATEVPRHLCCSNPNWLFRIYQDTIVDIPSVLLLLTNSLVESEDSGTEYRATMQIFPSKVGNVSCLRSQISLRLMWQQPWNIEDMNTDGVKYELWFQEGDEEDYSAYIVHQNELTVSVDQKDPKTYRVWIRCLVGDTQGPFHEVLC